MSAKDRPNIVCLVSEDYPPRLGAYGDPVARTPNLDRLAAEGVTWENANCTSPVCAPSRFAILTGRHAESCPRAQHMQTRAHLPASFDTYSGLMRKAGYYCANNFKTHYNCDVDPDAIWDECSPRAHWRGRAPDQPFMAVFNAMATHESCTFQPQEGAVHPRDVVLPSYLPDTPGMRESLARHYNAATRMDAEMGMRLRELEEDGLAQDTIVFYFSDHGSALPRSKRYLYDEGLRVPMIVRVPQKWRHLLPHAPGSRLAAPVSLVDLFPTFLAIAGIEPPQGLQGRVFVGPGCVDRTYVFAGRHRMGERYDLSRTVRSRRYRYIRNYQPHRPLGQHVAYEWLGAHYQDYEQARLDGGLDLVQGRFWGRKPFEEFYDLQADPDATVNLAGQAEHADALDAHRTALDEHMLAIHDAGFIPEHSPLEGWEAAHDPALYPLEDVLALAASSARADPAGRDRLVAGLGHASAVMRYWAAQGLIGLAVQGHALPDEVAQRCATETDIHVVIALSEALGTAREPEPWVRRLTGILEAGPDPRVRLQAMEALTCMPLRPAISLAVVDSFNEVHDQYLRTGSIYLSQLLRGTYRPRNVIFDEGRLDARAQTGAARL
ncbi:sulfatase [Mesorhizobium sp. L-8-10]|uniref:sulfatase-like hydrolase/transferase n=1 Tax=Mesorhizobium sp. L-8-10 TaxID=2744523 RepID=UPI0019261557|nr:sulfatase [Mesorhizobium sp. L-8-10]BCH35268.1 sulfatase [Mesorhizobium sp. L-8-10]